jgi:hypothetical protein
VNAIIQPTDDASVLHHLRSAARDSGIEGARVNVFTDSEGAEFCASAPNLSSPNGARIHGFGPTVAAALAELRKKIPAPMDSAAALRLEAARLAEMAAKIEGGEL